MPARVRVWLLGCAALLLVFAPFALTDTATDVSHHRAEVLAGQPAGPAAVRAVAPAEVRAAAPTEAQGAGPSEAQVAGPARAPAEARVPAGAALRQAYDLILDNFITPPAPAGLVQAASVEVARVAAEAFPGEWPTPTIAAESSRDEAWQIFSAWLDRAADLAAPKIDRATLDETALRAMAAAVTEHHTRYLSPRQHEEHQAWRRGDVKYEGIGVRLRRPSTVVLEVFEDSPSARAGLQTGDRIVAVDGEATTDTGAEAITDRIRGPLGSTVELLVERRGLTAPLTLRVERQEIRIAFVHWEVRTRATGERIGYLRVRGFPEPSVDEQVGQALEAFDRAGVGGLILDLRGNGGGRLDVGLKVISRFVREGSVFQQVDRAGRQRVARPQGNYWQGAVPTVALVDGGTASMGEILAAALQESGVAHVVGTRTMGSVAGARLFPLSNGGALQITVLTIVSGRGAILNDVGVQPNEEIELTDEHLLNGVDAQVEAALRHLEPGSRQLAEPTVPNQREPGDAA